MSYQDMIERVRDEDSDEAFIDAEQLQTAVDLVENFERGETSSYSEREVHTIEALKTMLDGYVSVVLGPVPRVTVTANYVFADRLPTRQQAVSVLYALRSRGLYYDLVSCEGTTLVLATRSRTDWECVADVTIALRNTFYTRSDGKLGTLWDQVSSIEENSQA